MADTGWRSPGTVVNDPTAGAWDWGFPERAKVSDDSRATRSGGKAGLYTHYLKATNFGFSIPTGATINGIWVQIERRGNPASAIYDVNVRIVKATGAFGTENKALGGFWSTTELYFGYGGAADLWSESWTPANINDSDFGVGMNAYVAGYAVADVDHIRIKVYYTEPLPDMKVNISDTFRQVSEIKINIGDSWRTVTKVQINIGDTWRTVFG